MAENGITIPYQGSSSSRPAIGFHGDEDTGINRSAANTMTMNCGGSVVGTFSSTGLDLAGLVQSGLKSSVEAKTANYTVTAAESGKTFTTVGAGGAVTFALPAAVVGLKYRFRVGAAQELRIDPNGTETIALPSTGVQGAAGKYLTADADGETVDIECTKAGQWSVFGFTGTWAHEA